MTETRGSDARSEGLTFPCRYPVKVMAESGARSEVLTVVRRHAGAAAPEEVRSRPSRNGRYEAITVTVAVETRAQLEALYVDLQRLDAVKMML
ncbi:YbeD family protein [Wenzhouxiangella limi]|uniref:DUF493 domain-containing protein n=1 Tax=Wenzhouxiangella limi TaxID=2707351 RepID=A0A845UV79_9GAMM|nr:DUF493 domain-containing protein [Wenzhouxiangella limi]NDY95743.1 DUF493 domain-containing protein [Wenzhouxiangella limi]